jgi:hypothetical protein
MHLEVAVLDVQRQVQTFALDCARQRGGDVEIQRVAEFVCLRCTAGLDAGGLVACVVTAEVRFPKRAQQIAQRAKAEEVEPLVGDLEARLRLRIANLSSSARDRAADRR